MAAEKDPGGHKWEGPLPKGWTDESRKKFWNSLTSRAPKHKVTQCIKRMKGKVSDPGAFCASLADRVIPGWREEAAKERKKKKAAAHDEIRKASASLAQPLRSRRDYGERDDEEEKDKAHSTLPGADTMSLGLEERDGMKYASSDWITLDEMSSLCPPCAERMKKAGFRKVRASVLQNMIRKSMR